MIVRTYANKIDKLPALLTRVCNILAPGQRISDFIFVGDVVDLYLCIGENLARNAINLRGHVYNAGANQPRAVCEVFETIFQLAGRQADLNAVLEMMKGRETVGEIKCQDMDHELVNRDFGWPPQHSFDRGVALTIEWFKVYFAHKHGA